MQEIINKLEKDIDNLRKILCECKDSVLMGYIVNKIEWSQDLITYCKSLDRGSGVVTHSGYYKVIIIETLIEDLESQLKPYDDSEYDDDSFDKGVVYCLQSLIKKYKKLL